MEDRLVKMSVYRVAQLYAAQPSVIFVCFCKKIREPFFNR
jgi:hypothetical protein